MRKLNVFNQISIDGYFKTTDGDISWLHQPDDDAEFKQFTNENAVSGGVLLFGRKTYETMVTFWPTPQAAEQFPEVARQMNSLPKVVFSKSLDQATWNNATIVKGDPVAEVRRMKSEAGPAMAILGSGSIVAQLTRAGLIDEYQVLVIPTVLSEGTSMFDGAGRMVNMTLANSRTFRNGRVFLVYHPKG
jgi:dihydrofolate reductase